jgi:Ca2+-binding EF-hand superfamily protein
MTISSYSSMGMMSPVSNISKDIISKSDINSDSSLSIDELGINEDQFSTLDSNGDSLVTQDEIASAIDNKLSSFDGEMPSKDEFASLLSDLGLEMPEPPIPNTNSSSTAGSDFSSLIMSQYDSNGDSLLSSDEVSLLSDDEFSALDTNSDGSVSSDELSTAFDQVSSSSNAQQSQSAPAGGGGGSSIVQDEEYDELDTNKDGIVSQEEKNAALGISTDETTSSALEATNQDTKDSIKLLLDTIKLNSQSSSEDLDLSNFKNIMKMMNNQSNNSDLNTYVSNLSSSNSSKFSYA